VQSDFTSCPETAILLRMIPPVSGRSVLSWRTAAESSIARAAGESWIAAVARVSGSCGCRAAESPSIGLILTQFSDLGGSVGSTPQRSSKINKRPESPDPTGSRSCPTRPEATARTVAALTSPAMPPGQHRSTTPTAQPLRGSAGLTRYVPLRKSSGSPGYLYSRSWTIGHAMTCLVVQDRRTR